MTTKPSFRLIYVAEFLHCVVNIGRYIIIIIKKNTFPWWRSHLCILNPSYYVMLIIHSFITLHERPFNDEIFSSVQRSVESMWITYVKVRWIKLRRNSYYYKPKLRTKLSLTFYSSCDDRRGIVVRAIALNRWHRHNDIIFLCKFFIL